MSLAFFEGFMDLKEKIELQKKHYKNGFKSLCLKCSNRDKDCFEAFKMTDKDKNTAFSTVIKCADFKEKK